MGHVTLEQARAAKPAALRRFGKIARVVGVGITRVNGEYAVKVNLREPVSSDVEVPDEIDGVRIRVEVTGPIRARKRPV